MKIVLVDTNIISYQHNQHSLWDTYKPLLNGQTLLTAAQSIAEMRYGAFRRNWGESRRAYLETVMGFYKVVYPNDEICTAWAKARADAEAQGRHLESNDAWIAATAITLDIPLVTHNIKHFDFLEGLALFAEHSK
jgi:tRNA(fMet)-specific endonuclease VapC